MVGVLGCMAERLKDKLLEQEKLVDLVVGPDAYRDLPKLVSSAEEGDKGINVFLSREETYADISPLRLDSNGVSAFISIMRGCDNMCSFCVVPFTRGRERSRNAFSILAEATDLFEKGYREVTLLGQNVDSYKWQNPETEEVVSFAQLLVMVAGVHPDLRIRFFHLSPQGHYRRGALRHGRTRKHLQLYSPPRTIGQQPGAGTDESHLRSPLVYGRRSAASMNWYRTVPSVPTSSRVFAARPKRNTARPSA